MTPDSSADQPQVTVVDNPAASRYECEVEGHQAELTYRRQGDRITLLHAGVPRPIGGRGIAGELVQYAIDRAAEEGVTVVPSCTYVRRWLDDHPDQAARVTLAR